jgi:hypothetical protein
MNPQEQSPFMKLPGEVRNKIYETLFVGKTVHVDTSPAEQQSDEVETENGAIPLYYDVVVPKFRGRLCSETPSRHDRFLNLTGPAREQRFDTTADTSSTPSISVRAAHTLDNAICNGVKCTHGQQTVVQSLQILRTCKKINSEAALLP